MEREAALEAALLHGIMREKIEAHVRSGYALPPGITLDAPAGAPHAQAR